MAEFDHNSVRGIVDDDTQGLLDTIANENPYISGRVNPDYDKALKALKERVISKMVVGANKQQLKRIKRHVDILQRALGRGKKTTQRKIENKRGAGGKEWEKKVTPMLDCKDHEVEESFGEFLTDGVFKHARALYEGGAFFKDYEMTEEEEKQGGVKLIFLDVDGVLNKGEGLPCNPHLEFLRQIVVSTKSRAKIVVSSSWRLQLGSFTLLTELITRSGFYFTDIVGTTPVFVQHDAKHGKKGKADLDSSNKKVRRRRPANETRGLQIMNWVKASPHPIFSYVCLDDFNIGKWVGKENFVHTKAHLGMQRENLELALKLVDRKSTVPRHVKVLWGLK